MNAFHRWEGRLRARVQALGRKARALGTRRLLVLMARVWRGLCALAASGRRGGHQALHAITQGWQQLREHWAEGERTRQALRAVAQGWQQLCDVGRRRWQDLYPRLLKAGQRLLELGRWLLDVGISSASAGCSRLLKAGRWLLYTGQRLLELTQGLWKRGLATGGRCLRQLLRWASEAGRWLLYAGRALWASLSQRTVSCWLASRHWLAVRVPMVRARVRQYALLTRLDRPIGTLLLMWPCLWALWIAAEGMPDRHILAVFLCGVFLMRSAGVVLNDIADRHFDGHVRRTQHRPLVAGDIDPLEALALAVVLLFLAFMLAALFLNTLTLLLAVVAVFLAATYPFMKRHTWLPQLYLGLAFAWAIPMAFAAQTGGVPLVAWTLLVASILWTASYDTIYALMDREDDQRIGLKSTAILFAEADVVFIGVMLLMLNCTLLVIAHSLRLGPWFYLAWLCALGNNIYQLWLIREREPEQCMRAFSSNNYYGMIIFVGLALHYGAH